MNPLAAIKCFDLVRDVNTLAARCTDWGPSWAQPTPAEDYTSTDRLKENNDGKREMVLIPQSKRESARPLGGLDLSQCPFQDASKTRLSKKDVCCVLFVMMSGR